MERNSGLTTRAQNLRKNMTLEERILWYQYLRAYPIQWNRQRVIGPYIVDFCCRRVKLIVELDGSQHYDPAGAAYDQERTQYLNVKGYAVLRFSNTDVKTNLPGVCSMIDFTVNKLLKAKGITLQNLPLGEGAPEGGG